MDIYAIIAMVVLILLSGLFSATETAFNTFNRAKLKNLAQNGNKRAELVLVTADNYDALLSSILIGNNIVNIALTAIATVQFVSLLGNSGSAVSTAVTTVLVLIFGEVSPKSVAKEKADGFVMAIVPFIRILIVLFTPLNLFFKLWKKLLSVIFKSGESKGMTDEEIMTIVDEAQQDGGIDEQEGELIKSAIEFTDAEVEAIITPRVDVVAIDKDTPYDEIAEIFRTSGFSRLPVYEETVDSIIGILHEKDFYHSAVNGDADIVSLLKKPFMITCHVKISKLLTQFQQAKSHMAVVLDDYGGTMGIVTLEDVIEELVGDIYDEHDEVEDSQVTEHSDGTVTLAGDTRTAELFEMFELDSEDDEELPQTVSGWVTMMLGEFPEVGVTIDYESIRVRVTGVDDKLATEVRITRIEPEEDKNKSEAEG